MFVQTNSNNQPLNFMNIALTVTGLGVLLFVVFYFTIIKPLIRDSVAAKTETENMIIKDEFLKRRLEGKEIIVFLRTGDLRATAAEDAVREELQYYGAKNVLLSEGPAQDNFLQKLTSDEGPGKELLLMGRVDVYPPSPIALHRTTSLYVIRAELQCGDRRKILLRINGRDATSLRDVARICIEAIAHVSDTTWNA